MDEYTPLPEHSFEWIADDIWRSLKKSRNNEILSLNFDACVSNAQLIVEDELVQKGAIGEFSLTRLVEQGNYPRDFHERSMMFALIYVKMSRIRFNQNKVEEAWAYLIRASRHLGVVDILEDVSFFNELKLEYKGQRSKAGKSNKQSANSGDIKAKALEIMAQGVPKDNRRQLGARTYLANELIPFLKEIKSNIKHENLSGLFTKWRQSVKFRESLEAFEASSEWLIKS